MESLRMRQTYSYIGDLTDFLIQNEQRIKNLMIDYEIQSKVDTLPDGREVKSLMFTKQNVNVRFLPNRIDYTFSFPTPSTDPQEAYNSAKAYFKLFSEIFYTIEGQRVAIVSQAFIKNENNQAIADFHSKMGFTSVFGMSNELHFKINNPKTVYEPINSVLNIDMGEAKNNNTQEVMKVLLVSIDVNTLAANTAPRFKTSNFDLDFKELFDEIEDKHRALNRY